METCSGLTAISGGYLELFQARTLAVTHAYLTYLYLVLGSLTLPTYLLVCFSRSR